MRLLGLDLSRTYALSDPLGPARHQVAPQPLVSIHRCLFALSESFWL
jgi:hypothetical protein